MNKGLLGAPIGWRGRASFTPNAFSGCRVGRNTLQSVPRLIITSAVWDTVAYDTDRYVDLANFPTRITMQHGGWYEIGGSGLCNSLVTSTSAVILAYGTQAGGSGLKYLGRRSTSNSSVAATSNVSTVAFFEPTDFFEVGLLQTDSGNRNWGNAGNLDQFNLCAWATRIG